MPDKPRALVQPIHSIVAVSLCLCLASFPFEFPDRTFRWEIPTMTTSLFLLATLFFPRACYFSYIPPTIWSLVVFLYTMAVALAVNGWVSLADTAQEVILFIQAMLFFCACLNLLRHDKIARAAMWSFVIASLIRAALPFLGIGRTGEAVWTGGERVTAFGQNANWSAKLLATAAVMLVGLVFVHLQAPRRMRLLAVLGVGGLAVAIVDTGSRGGLLSLAVGLLAFAFAPSSSRGALTMVRNAFIGVAAITFLIVAAMRTEVMRNRFVETAETGSMAGREVLFPTLVGMFVEKPWAGWGPVNNQFELAQRINERNHLTRDSHNLVLEVLTTTGIIGAIPFFIGLGPVVVAAWRARNGLHGITPAALLSMHLIASMSGNPITSKLFWFVCAYALAAAVPVATRQTIARASAPVPLPLVRA